MHKKIIVLCLVCSVLGISTFIFVTTNTNSTLNNNTSIQVATSTKLVDDHLPKEPLTQALINKATPFVKTSESKFYLSKEGYSSLTPTEIKTILFYINSSNANLKEISKTKDLIKSENSFSIQ